MVAPELTITVSSKEAASATGFQPLPSMRKSDQPERRDRRSTSLSTRAFKCAGARKRSP